MKMESICLYVCCFCLASDKRYEISIWLSSNNTLNTSYNNHASRYNNHASRLMINHIHKIDYEYGNSED